MSRNKSLIFSVIICLIISSASLLAAIRLYNAITVAAPWRIYRINISGNKNLSNAEIYDTLGVPYGASIWWYSLPDLAERLKRHPWIREAFVRWDFPNVLSVQVVERQLFVTICCDECYYIDNFGVVFDKCNECNLSARVVKLKECDDVIYSRGKIEYVRSDFFQKLSVLLKAVVENRFPVESTFFDYDAERGFSVNAGNIQILLGFEDFQQRLKVAKRIVREISDVYGKEAKLELDARYSRKVFLRPCITDGKEKHGTQS